MVTETQCLLDMDGVLCDFVTRRLQLAGITDPNWYDQFPGNHDLQRCMGMSTIEFYGELDRNFWANLNWMPDGKEILKHVEERFGKENVCLCTSPTRDDECIPGKKAWIRKHLGSHYLRNVMFTNVKFFASGPNRLLVDDSEAHVDEYKGPSYLLPRIWNRRHAERHSTVPDLIVRLYQ